MGRWRITLVFLALALLAVGVCPQESKCNGCIVKDRCIQIGVRLEGQYCWLDGQLKPQSQKGEKCENAFECVNNHCIDGLCQDQAAKGLYDELKDWIFHIFRIVFIKRF
jgi:hypothetical protein